MEGGGGGGYMFYYCEYASYEYSNCVGAVFVEASSGLRANDALRFS